MMGVMVTQGAADHDTHDVGERCWAVLLLERDESARIASASAPPSPTEEELAAAIEWQVSRTNGLYIVRSLLRL